MKKPFYWKILPSKYYIFYKSNNSYKKTKFRKQIDRYIKKTKFFQKN